MLTMLNYFRTRYMSEKAQGMAEYALVLAFVVGVIALVVANGGLGTAINNAFTKVSNSINNGGKG